MMAMEGALDLARGQDGQVIAEIPGPDVLADGGAARREHAILLDIVKFGLVEVHQWFRHGRLLPAPLGLIAWAAAG